MTIDLRSYTRQCVEKLRERYRRSPEHFGFESDFHSDLFYLLCAEDKRFWESYAVQMGEKGDFQGTDIVLYDPILIKKDFFSN